MEAGLAARVDEVLAIPLHRFLALSLVDGQDPTAGIHLPVGPGAVNNAGVLHGGVLAAVLDVVSYLTLLPQLSGTENAVTNSLTVSLLRPVAAGRQLQARATVLRRGRNLVYLRADATAGDEMVGAAQVTKTILRSGSSL